MGDAKLLCEQHKDNKGTRQKKSVENSTLGSDPQKKIEKNMV